MAKLDINQTARNIAKRAMQELMDAGVMFARWIPVSERLPEKTGLYLISIGDLVTTGSFDGHNFRTQTMVRFVPDAWMSLPEPYKAESEK